MHNEVTNIIDNQECEFIIDYLDKEPKTWTNDKTMISFYDKRLKYYKLNEYYFQQLYFKLKKVIESTYNNNIINLKYFFIKNNNLNTFLNKNNNIFTFNIKLNNSTYSIMSEWTNSNKSTANSYVNNIYVNKEIFHYKSYIKNHKDIIDKLEKSKGWKFYSTKELNKKPYEKNSYEYSEYKVIKINELGQDFLSCIKDYEYKNNIKLVKFSNPLVVKSYPGKMFGMHVDSSSEHSDPDISIIIDLNDDYEGGELLFNNHNVLIKPYAGSILIYPSKEPYYHSPQLIEMGSKIYCIIYGFKE